MNEVFISYSRRDKDFTQKLFETLEKANRSTWADWDDIPAGSDWLTEIKEGIENSNSVLFILSPEWVKSGECRKEYTYAVEMGKRLIPIIWQMIDSKDVPEELAKINWIYMRESDDFEKAFQSLCTTMDTDLDWVKSHTRLQGRALEWEKKKQDHSFVLRGRDLEQAEQFMAQSAHKSPEPTELQREYILASRKDATKRQRLTLGGVVIALVISIALGVVAVFQWQASVKAHQVAITERDRADLNAKLSFARELSAGSLNNLESDPERSLLLALQAVDVIKKAGQPIQPETEDALRRALQTSRLRLTIPAHNGFVWGVSFSPDGRLLATAGQDQSVKVWDISGKSAVLSAEPVLTLDSFDSDVTSVAFSPDGILLVTAGYDNTAILWDVKTGKEIQTFNGHSGGINKVIFSPDGTSIITASTDNTAIIWDVSTGELVFDLIGHTDALTSVAISTDGNRIATASNDGTVIIWDTGDGSQLISFGEGCSMNDVMFSSDGESVATADNCLQSAVWNINTGESITRNQDHTDSVTGVSFSPDGVLIASASRDNIVVVTDSSTSRQKFNLIDTSDIYTLAFSPNGDYIATGNANGQVKIWDANSINGYEIKGFRPHTSRIDGMEFSVDNQHYVSSSWDGTAFIWSLSDESPIELVGHEDQIRDVAISADGTKIITGGYDGMAIIWDAAKGNQIRTLSGNSQNVMAVGFSPDGKLAAGGLENNTVIIWEVATGKEVATLQSDDQNFINEVAFNPDGTILAVASDINTTTLWDTATWKQQNTLLGHSDWVKGVAFSPDGKHIVTGSYDTTAIVWDATTGEQLFTLSGHAQGINDVAFSPDGTLIATASVDGSAKIWNAATGKLITTMLARPDPILSVAFSKDGNIFATGSETGVIRFYYIHFEDVLSLAKTRITRSLTELECKTYLHEAQCPDTIIKP